MARWSAKVLEKTMMSSRYAKQISHLRLVKTLSIWRENVAGVLHNPRAMVSWWYTVVTAHRVLTLGVWGGARRSSSLKAGRGSVSSHVVAIQWPRGGVQFAVWQATVEQKFSVWQLESCLERWEDLPLWQVWELPFQVLELMGSSQAIGKLRGQGREE